MLCDLRIVQTYRQPNTQGNCNNSSTNHENYQQAASSPPINTAKPPLPITPRVRHISLYKLALCFSIPIVVPRRGVMRHRRSIVGSCPRYVGWRWDAMVAKSTAGRLSGDAEGSWGCRWAGRGGR